VGLLPDISPFGLFSHSNLKEPISNWELSIYTVGRSRCYCGGSWPSLCEEIFASGMGENSMKVPQKVKNIELTSSNCTTRYLPKGYKSTDLKGYMHTDVYSSIINNSQIITYSV